MKFSCKVHINAPKSKVVKMFSNTDNLKEWQDGFQSKQLISGESGQEGAVSEMRYKSKIGAMLITETIISNKLPDEFIGQYEHEHTSNTMISIFVELADGTTEFSSEINYTRLSGVILNIMAFIAPFLFKKQVQKWMNQFKALVEKSL
jgi:hypothetical protein